MRRQGVEKARTRLILDKVVPADHLVRQIDAVLKYLPDRGYKRRCFAVR